MIGRVRDISSHADHFQIGSVLLVQVLFRL